MSFFRPDRLATLSLARAMRTCRVLRSAPGLPILMYHSVSDEAEPGVADYYKTHTSPAQFRRHMRFLREQGYKSLALHDAVARLSAGLAPQEKLVVITFDDGYRDFHTHAAPLLEECGFTATVYLPTAFIGGQRRRFRGRDCLCWEEVRELRARGFHFGSHTVHHPQLHGLPWDCIARELAESKAQLEQALQLDVLDFAYPFAFPQQDRDFAARFMELLQSAEYQSSVTTIIGRARSGDSPLCLWRLPVNGCDDTRFLGAKLVGAYDWLRFAQTAVKRVKGPLSRRSNTPHPSKVSPVPSVG